MLLSCRSFVVVLLAFFILVETVWANPPIDPAQRATCMERARENMGECFYSTPLRVLPGRRTKFLHCIKTYIRCTPLACEYYADCMREIYPEIDEEIFLEQCDQSFWAGNGPFLIEPYINYCYQFQQPA